MTAASLAASIRDGAAMKVTLADDLADRIRRHAEQSYPFEACGLLSGTRHTDGTVTLSGVHESANVTERDRRTGFEVDPKLRFDLMRALEAQNDGTAIIGHYHSHPDHPGEPSGTDLSMVYEPAFIWLICASTPNGADAIGAFRANTDISGFDRLEIKLNAG